jgi:outer membrane receptor for ferrienterochelin and colicins
MASPAGAPDRPAEKEAPSTLPGVSVEGARNENAARRASVAGRIVIDRRDIDASGSSTVGQMLRNEPAITIAADGRLSLMGLPGYTKLLLDGDPPPNGKSVLDLDLSQVERIEIIKSATAETGAFGIAGTINIVSRRIDPRAEQQLRLNLGRGALDSSARGAWTLNRPGDADGFGYRATVSASRRQQRETKKETVAAGGDPASLRPLWGGGAATDAVKEHLNASSTLRWVLPERNKLEVSPSAVWLRNSSASAMHYAGRAGGEPPADALLEGGHSLLVSYSGDILWAHETERGLKLELRWAPTLMHEQARATQDVMTGPALARYADQYARTMHLQHLKLRADGELQRGHDLKAGASASAWDGQGDVRAEVNDLPDLSLLAFGTTQGEHSRRFSGFVEYDGQISKAFAMNAGLRHEHQKVRMNEGSIRTLGGYSLLAPSLHATYKIDEAGKRQIRASVARTFNAPFKDQLLQRPSQVNALASCPPAQLCGPNSVERADVAGNPDLRPERSLGVNLSFEQQWGSDSRVRVEAFSRSIRDVFVTETRLQVVPWASTARYVNRPENLGRAEVRGLALESSLRLDELEPGWPRFKLRTGLQWARSRLTEVPGPDNRFAGQDPWSAKLGLDYTPAGATWDCSLNASVSPAGWVRSAPNQRYFESRRRDFSAESSWAPNARLKWRLALRDLMPRDRTRVDEFEQGGGFITRSAETRAAMSVQLSAEFKL